MLIVLFLTTTTINRIHLSLVMNMMRTIVQVLIFAKIQQGFFLQPFTFAHV
jgi:hypothetical protein